jgi:hypothetical protein
MTTWEDSLHTGHISQPFKWFWIFLCFFLSLYNVPQGTRYTNIHLPDSKIVDTDVGQFSHSPWIVIAYWMIKVPLNLYELLFKTSLLLIF